MMNDKFERWQLRVRGIHKDWPLRPGMFLLLTSMFLHVGAGWLIVPAVVLVLSTGKVFFVKPVFGACAVWLMSHKMGARLCDRAGSLLDGYIRNL